MDLDRGHLIHLRLVNNAGVINRAYILPTVWEKAVDGWLSWLRIQGASDTTLRTRRGQVRVIARQSKSSHPRDIDIKTLVTLIGRPGLSADHKHGQRAALISFYTWCVNNDVTAHNPAALLPKIKAGKPRPRPTPDDVWSRLLASAPPREALMALLACEAGLRRAEVASLHYDDLARDHDGWVLIVKGKGDKQRVLPIPDQLASALRRHCSGGYVFPGQMHEPGRAGGHIAPDTVGRLISRLMPRGWTMHKLRHRFATNGFNGTRNLLAVQEALGHSSVATTQRYTAVNLTDIRAVSNAAASRNSSCHAARALAKARNNRIGIVIE